MSGLTDTVFCQDFIRKRQAGKEAGGVLRLFTVSDDFRSKKQTGFVNEKLGENFSKLVLGKISFRDSLLDQMDRPGRTGIDAQTAAIDAFLGVDLSVFGIGGPGWTDV